MARVDKDKVIKLKNEGWTQKDIAEALGTSQPYVSAICRKYKLERSEERYLESRSNQRIASLRRRAVSMTAEQYLAEFVNLKLMGDNICYEDVVLDLRLILHNEERGIEPESDPFEHLTPAEKIALIKERNQFGV